jgi:hypothetical protein
MPSLDLLLLSLLGGYLFLITFNYTKYYHQRVERQRLIFNSLIFGFLLSIIGFSLDYLILQNFLGFRKFLGELIPIEYDGLNQSAFIFSISYPFALVLNLLIPERKTLGLIINKWGDDMEKLFWNSLISINGVNKLLMVTTLSGKVYVGYINKISKPIGNPQITIIPNFSGYRDKDNHQFFITTDYFGVLEDLINEGKSNQIDKMIGIVIPREQITMVSKFSLEVFNRFQGSSDENNLEDKRNEETEPKKISKLDRKSFKIIKYKGFEYFSYKDFNTK